MRRERGAEMHILFVADADSRYGASHSMFQMVTALGRIDPSMKRSVVLTMDSSLAPAFEKQGCDVYRIRYYPYFQTAPQKRWKFPAKYMIRGTQYFWGRTYGLRELEKELDISSVDIIHSNSSREDLSALLAEKYDKPLLWHIREFGDRDYECYSYRKNYIDLMNRQATKMVAISDAVREHWIKKGIRPEKIIRIYNGVDDDMPQKADYRKSSSEPLRLVMAGSISETKGQVQLVEALGKLPQEICERVTLDIIGDVNMKSTYIKRVNKMIGGGYSGHIRMLGYREDVCSLLHEYDCGVMCSRSEGFGRVTAEYMMAGLPVIASDTGANPELVNEGKTGLFYRWGDTSDLAKKIELLADDALLCERMGLQAAAYAHANLTAHKNAQCIYEEYRSILDGRDRPVR